MTKGCNIWMICLKLNRFFYGLSCMLHRSEFVWILRSSVLVVFNNFLLIDATDRSKIRSDQKRFFIALSLYPLSFFANTPFKVTPVSSQRWQFPIHNGTLKTFDWSRLSDFSHFSTKTYLIVFKLFLSLKNIKCTF